MSTELTTLMAQLPADKTAEHAARMAGNPLDPEGEARQKRLLDHVKALRQEEMPLVTPLLSHAMDPTLRQEVLKAFERVDAAGGAALLIREAEEKRPAPGFGLASGTDALSFTLTNFGSYGGALVGLKAAFGRDRARLRAIASGLDKYEQETFEEGIGALGLADEDIAEIKKQFAAGKHQAVRRLTKALMPLDPRVGEVVSELQEHARRLAPKGSRDYGQTLYVLSEVARLFAVDPTLFTDAVQKYPKSNEFEMALTGLKRAASLCAKNKDRASFDRLLAAVKTVGGIPALEKHFSTLNWT